MTDDDVLVAMIYDGAARFEWIFDAFDLDPPSLAARARRAGLTLPAVDPPELDPPHGPFGPYVVFPAEHRAAVTRQLMQRFPPGTGHWGFNMARDSVSCWVVGERDLGLPALVIEVLGADLVRVVPITESRP